MSKPEEIAIPQLEAWAKALRKAALGSNHRVSVVVSGKEAWCDEVAKAILAAAGLQDSWWITETKSSPENSKPAAQARTLLGHDTDTVVFNAWSRFDPDAFAAVSGNINGGGFLLLLTPPLDDWPDFSDPDNARVTVYPVPPEQVSGRYLKRLVKLIRKSDKVLRIEQGKDLPVLKIEADISTASIPDVGECRTADQLKAVQAIEKVALGRRRRPLVITSDRGRGKTSSLGIAAAHLLKHGLNKIIITEPRYVTAKLVFDRVKLLIPDAEFSRGLIVYGDSKIVFLPPDELSLQAPQADLVCVDEAAAIPASLLEKILRRYARIVFASTVHGYEGSGRGFAIRFKKILNEQAPGWKYLQLKTPIRWSENDPLEAFVSRAMLLDASVSNEVIPAEFNLTDYSIERLDRDLLSGNEKTLGNLFGLLVQAHYRTSPIDLRHLLDGPNISIYVARRAGRIYATALVATEGGLDDGICESIFAGKRRPQGHLLPQTMIAQGGFSDIGGLHCLRILRIAVDPRVQRHGLGTALLNAVIRNAEKNRFDYVGASFSLLPGMLRFWRSSNFNPVLIGMTKNTASAAHSVVVLRGISDKGKELNDAARTRFGQIFPHWLSDPLRDIDTEIAYELLCQSEPYSSLELTDQDRQNLQSFIDGQRGFEVNILSIWKAVSTNLHLNRITSCLTEKEQSVLIGKVLQKRSWSEVADTTGLKGRAAVMATMREAIRKIVHHV
jgi:tRNA(Met) cytidine acetyltransferase